MSYFEGTLALVVAFFSVRYISARLKEAQAETVDERSARDEDVTNMVSSALGSRPKKRAPAEKDSD